MARNIGSWWMKDGIDGRRIEAQGFASLLATAAGYAWTVDLGDSSVLAKDFVETANYNEKVDSVDAVMMSSHGNPDGFAVHNGSVTTSNTIKFGKGDLEIFATHACKLLENSAAHPVGRWCGAFDRLHYMCGFHNSSYSGGGQNARGTYFAMYAAWLSTAIPWTAPYPVREAWKMANVLVEGADVEWAYLRATAPGADTYNEVLGTGEPADPVANRSFWTAHGSC
jgi:Family of unknown function (DUF6345)